MPEASTSYTAAGMVVVTLAVVLVILLAIIGYRAWQGSRITAAERERRRCARLEAYGKMGDAALLEIRESVIFYSYAVGGVEYTASQDLTVLGRAPVDLTSVHATGVKYDPRNPANSIVMSEEWSGLRGAHPAGEHTSEPRP